MGSEAAHRLHPVSWGLSRNATLTLLRMVGPGSPPNIVNLTNAISIGSSVNVNKNVAEFWQYLMKKMLQNFGSILSILFLIYYL